MTSHLTFLLLGLGVGAVIASLALGIVVTHRASGVINFAHAATGTFIALGYYELRATGDLRRRWRDATCRGRRGRRGARGAGRALAVERGVCVDMTSQLRRAGLVTEHIRSAGLH